MSIRSPSFLGLSNFDDALVPDGDEVTVDLSCLEFIDAYGLVGLASHVVQSELEGRDIYMITPEDRGAAAYLSRMHVSDLVRDLGVKLDRPLPRVKERDRQDSLIELQPFSNKSLKPFVSGTDDPHRGQGLPDIVDSVTGFGGVVYVRSGAAARRMTRAGAAAEQVCHLQGPIVGARVPCRPGR